MARPWRCAACHPVRSNSLLILIKTIVVKEIGWMDGKVVQSYICFTTDETFDRFSPLAEPPSSYSIPQFEVVVLELSLNLHFFLHNHLKTILHGNSLLFVPESPLDLWWAATDNAFRCPTRPQVTFRWCFCLTPFEPQWQPWWTPQPLLFFF